MCSAMGNAIRLLKSEVNKYDIDTPEDEAKEGLLATIDGFIRERITLAEFVVSRNAADLIRDGSVVLTYGRHRLVEKAILRAARHDGKRFDVVIHDDPCDPTGTELAKTLGKEVGIGVDYSATLSGLDGSVRRAWLVLLGAEAIFLNGAVHAPDGTADVALVAHSAGKDIVVLCETINYDKERLALDSGTFNEIDPDRREAPSGFRLLFDTTPAQLVSKIVTEQDVS